MTTIRRRLTVLVHGGARRDRARVRDRCCTSSGGQSSLRELDQRLLLEADLAERWLSESYNVLGRIVTTAGGQPGPRPGHQRLPGCGPRLPRRGGHGGPGARALRRDPRAGRGRPPGADRRAGHACGRRSAPAPWTSAPRRGARATWPCGCEDAGPEVGGVLVATSLERCRVRPHRAASLHAAHRPGHPRGGRGWSATGSPGPASGRWRASWTRWRPSATAGASTGGSRVPHLRRRDGAARAHGERHARPAGAELRQPAPLHRRREPRAQDAAHGAPRRCGAGPGAPGHAGGDPPVAGRDAGRRSTRCRRWWRTC